MTFKKAIAKIEKEMQESIKNNELLELKLWKKYKEQLEVIAIILG